MASKRGGNLIRSAWARWLKLQQPRAFILRMTYLGKQREFAVVREHGYEGGALVVYDHKGIPMATGRATEI